jgi:hypothetical protein
MQCRICDNYFPTIIKIDGKSRNLQNRKYCLDCSPFGKHNTKKLTKAITAGVQPRFCKTCNREIVRKNEKTSDCWVCTNKKQRIRNISKVQELTGKSCWFCGYNIFWGALEFHHVNPENKLHNLSTREMQFSWDRILRELKKCVLACSCCHKEIHAGIIENNEVIKQFKNYWGNDAII